MKNPVSLVVTAVLTFGAALAFIAFASTVAPPGPSSAEAYAIPRVMQDTRAILTADLNQSDLSVNIQRNHFQPNHVQLLTRQGNLITYELRGGTLTRSSAFGSSTLGTGISSFTPTIKGRNVQFAITFADSIPYNFTVLTPKADTR